MIKALGGLRSDSQSSPTLNSSQVFQPLYQVTARHRIVPRIEATLSNRARFLEFSRLITRSIFACPSSFSSQAAPRKAIQRRQYSTISNVHPIGVLKKYLEMTDKQTRNHITPSNIMIMPLVKFNILSKILLILAPNRKIFRASKCNCLRKLCHIIKLLF